MQYFFRFPGDDGKRKASMLAHMEDLSSSEHRWSSRWASFFAHFLPPMGKRNSVSVSSVVKK